MHVPSRTGDISRNTNPGVMETTRHNAMNKEASLYNKLAKFVLDLQTDVTLEDVLDNSEDSNAIMKEPVPPQKYQTIDRNDVHRRHLEYLYREIKKHQTGVINGHEQSSKRRSSEGSMGLKRSKTHRTSESNLLQDIDGIDESWLMSLASQLGLDKEMDLPELSSDLMKEII